MRMTSPIVLVLTGAYLALIRSPSPAFACRLPCSTGCTFASRSAVHDGARAAGANWIRGLSLEAPLTTAGTTSHLSARQFGTTTEASWRSSRSSGDSPLRAPRTSYRQTIEAVSTPAVVRSALERIPPADAVLAVGADFTREAATLLEERGAVVARIGEFGWTDESYIGLRARSR